MELANANKDRNKRRKPAIDVSAMVYGKVPPQAKDLEEAVLGAIMLDKTAFDIVAEILTPASFYVDNNQRVFNAFRLMNAKNIPIDILTVVEQLKSTEELDLCGGPYYVTRLTNAVVGIGNIEAHARIILQKFISRELIRISGEIITDAYDDTENPLDMLEDAAMKIDLIDRNIFRGDIADMITCSTEFITSLDKKINSPKTLTGVTTGFHELDICTHGWQNSDLIILAARPSVGKTALSINLALKAALNPVGPVPVALFNMEMSRGQVMERIISAVSEIPLFKIRRGYVEPEERELIHNKVIPKLERAPIYIDDTAGLNWMELKSKARKLKRKQNIGLIIIDYLQLMNDVKDGEKRNREQQVANITRNLKILAKELNIPIIALSQLSRAVETRSEKKGEPVLSDLRESGAIEQDADVVAFIYRPDYYDLQKSDVAGETFIKIAKHRNGTLEKIKLVAKLHIQKFYDPNDERLNGTPINKTPEMKNINSNDFAEGVPETKYKF